MTSETGAKLTDALRESLRPYGGTFAVTSGNRLMLVRRKGPIAGSGQWTHEYARPGNALSSAETIARAPLGLLWYEGPAGNARFYFDGNVDHQSGHGVSPLPPGAEIVEGRMILQGPGRLGAFDVYTGRLLWETELPEVYGFGGPEGGVGIHSMKHREPWRYPRAMNAELPATHHSRTTGLNFTSAAAGIYVCAGGELLYFSPEDGSRRSAWEVPLPQSDRETLCWGSVRVSGDRLIATAFRPQDLVDAQCGHDGNGGDWSKDRMPMTHLIVLDRTTGKLLWSRRAEFGFLNRGIAVGRGTVFCVDTMAPNTLEKFHQANRRLPSTPPMLYALDLQSGRADVGPARQRRQTALADRRRGLLRAARRGRRHAPRPLLLHPRTAYRPPPPACQSVDRAGRDVALPQGRMQPPDRLPHAVHLAHGVLRSGRAERVDAALRHEHRLHAHHAAGRRVFTVSLEGKAVLKDLDLFKATGGKQKHLVRELKNVEVQGPLNLSFSASRGKPIICGVEVVGR